MTPPISIEIVLIEDDADDQFFFTEAIREIRHTHLLAIAGNGCEAIEKINSGTILPDIIFMDNNMPRMDGIECLKRLKESDRTKNIPVIMLTSDLSCAENARKLRVEAFIQKVASFKMLRSKIEQAIIPVLRRTPCGIL